LKLIEIYTIWYIHRYILRTHGGAIVIVVTVVVVAVGSVVVGCI